MDPGVKRSKHDTTHLVDSKEDQQDRRNSEGNVLYGRPRMISGAL